MILLDFGEMFDLQMSKQQVTFFLLPVIFGSEI